MIYIDKNLCTGCGKCERICPEGFEVRDGTAVVINENARGIDDAAASCPFRAIVSDKAPEQSGYSRAGESSFAGRGTGGGRGSGRGMGRGKGRGLGKGPRDGSGGGSGGGGRR